MDFDSLKLGWIAVAPVVVGAVHWIKVYHGIRADRFKLSSRRLKRFYTLVSSGAWRKTSPAALQMAFVEAYGYELDDRSIRFALARHRSLAMFRDLRWCGGMVRLDKEGKGFEKWNGLKVKSLTYRTHGQIMYALGFTPYVLFMVFGAYLTTIWSKPTVVGTWICLTCWCFAAMFLANCFESAHRVVEDLEGLFPAWVPGGSSDGAAITNESEPPPAASGQKPRRQRVKKAVVVDPV